MHDIAIIKQYSFWMSMLFFKWIVIEEKCSSGVFHIKSTVGKLLPYPRLYSQQ